MNKSINDQQSILVKVIVMQDSVHVNSVCECIRAGLNNRTNMQQNNKLMPHLWWLWHLSKLCGSTRKECIGKNEISSQ